MSQQLNNSPPPAGEGTSTQPLSADAEASVRQLIAAGHDKTALKRARAIHETLGATASEALLVEAYAARIQSLIRQNLAAEAHGMLDLVRRRHPSAAPRLDELRNRALVRAGSLDEVVAPLNDPGLSAERHRAIERVVRQDVWDVATLAGCATLAPEHPLRKAASALNRAFVDVTSGPVDESALALQEVSHRSPLAPWTLLVRAIACFYRGEDEPCRRYLDAITPESAPARLAPAIQAALGRATGTPLMAAAGELVARMTGDPAALRRALDALDRSFESDEIQRTGRILTSIRAAVQECRRSSPGHLDRLKQHIAVRCAVAELNKDQVTAALGGPSRHDAYFLRLFARSMEETRNAEGLAMACSLWAQFRQLAVQEGWFAANGVEVATLYLHMAELLQRLPEELQRALQRPARSKNQSDEDVYFLFPEKLYQRACALDPHTDAFAHWMNWAARHAIMQCESIAQAWHKICPRDLQPVLHLMEASEKRKAFSNALAYLAMAEQIDSVHSGVRGARLRLQAEDAMRHIQQKKLGLAEDDLVRMAALPQTQQGDRPAFLAALRSVLSAVRGRDEEAVRFRADVERLLETRAAAAILLGSVAAATKQRVVHTCVPLEQLTSAERAVVPAAVARVTALAADLHIPLDISSPWIFEAAKQFPKSNPTLDSEQLFGLAEAAIASKHLELAYAVSAVGLVRGGDTAARFLLVRARSLPEPKFERRAVCATAAAVLGRDQHDTELVRAAVELVRDSAEFANLSLTLDQAGEVLRREKKSKGRRGPSYRDIVEVPCQCLDCRRARGEIVDPFGDDDLSDEDEMDAMEIPPDMPPEVARMLFEATKSAVARGESLEQLLSRLMGGGRPGRKRMKGGRT